MLSPLFDFILENTSNDIGLVIFRSLIFGILTAVSSVVLGVYLGIKWSSDILSSWHKRNLPILVIPIILGNITIAYVCKLVFKNTAIFDFVVSNGTLHLIALSLIQTWQYGLLFAYIVWSKLNSISKDKMLYARVTFLNNFEKLRDIYIPEIKHVIVLLFFIGFIFSFYENTKNTLFFKASQGQNTELISQALTRINQSNMQISQAYADEKVIIVGIIIFFISVLLLHIVGALFNVGCKVMSRINFFCSRYAHNNIPNTDSGGKRSLYLCIITIIAPLAIALYMSFSHIQLNQFTIDIIGLIRTILLSIFAALLATMISVLISTLLRICFANYMHSLNSMSLKILLITLCIQLIPPLCIVIWLFKFQTGEVMIIKWIVGHIILSFPLLCSFAIITHFGITNKEIYYYKVNHITFVDIFYIGFFKRFKSEYLFMVLFAFSLVLNDTSINMVFSDAIPAYAKELEMSFNGRGVNYHQASVLFGISIIITFTCICILTKYNSKLIDKDFAYEKNKI